MKERNLMDYTDFRQFLRDVYRDRLKVDPGYSLKAMSKELGFHSPSFIFVLITSDRNLSPKNRARLATGLGLNDGEKKFLNLLIDLDTTADGEERDLIHKRLS